MELREMFQPLVRAAVPPAIESIRRRVRVRRRRRRAVSGAAATIVLGVVIGASLLLGGGSHRTRTLGAGVTTPNARPSAPTPAGTSPCPGTLHIDEHSSPDALPSAQTPTGDRGYVDGVVKADGERIRASYRGVVDVGVGPGHGYEWDRRPDGSVFVRPVSNYAIYVHLRSRADCPTGTALHIAYEGIDTVFVAP